MGPLATVDFLDKLVRATPVATDQDHIPLLVRFCPEVPDRVAALLQGGPSPAPALMAAARLAMWTRISILIAASTAPVNAFALSA